MRTMEQVDRECIATARVYIAAAKHGGLSEPTLLAIVARVAALRWVLNPAASEVQAQGEAWALIAQLREEVAP